MDNFTKSLVVLASITVVVLGAVRPAIRSINNYVQQQETIKLRSDTAKQKLKEEEICLSEVEILRMNPDPDMSQWEYEEYLNGLIQSCRY